MVSNEMLQLGTNPSAIRDLFEYGNKRKAEIGAENVFDFSIGIQVFLRRTASKMLFRNC